MTSAVSVKDKHMLIYNAHIFPADSDPIPNGFVEVTGSKICAVRCGSPEKVCDADIDAQGKTLLPGFIDIHTHMGFIGDGSGEEGIDVNEGSDPVTPHLRAVDGLNFRDGYFADAVKAGITSVVSGVGSLNPIGGDMIALKTSGRCLDDAFIRTVGIKFALGENPKSRYTDMDEAPQTRMATAALIREALYKAKRYMNDKQAAENDPELAPPDYDIKSEALIPLLRGELKAHIHCHRADDILTALRLCDEFSLKPLLIHCTEGHLIADILAEKHAEAVVGPVISDRGKPELANLTTSNAAALDRAGVKLALCTDHPENPIGTLAVGAALCIKSGLPRGRALQALTLTAAELAMISDRTGSITVGKDADLIMLNGDPFNIFTETIMTMIGGKIVYSAAAQK